MNMGRNAVNMMPMEPKFSAPPLMVELRAALRKPAAPISAPQTVYQHEMGLKRGGNLIIMGGCGPMGLGAVAYACVCKYDPAKIVVTDVDDAKITAIDDEKHKISLSIRALSEPAPVKAAEAEEEAFEEAPAEAEEDALVYEVSADGVASGIAPEVEE